MLRSTARALALGLLAILAPLRALAVAPPYPPEWKPVAISQWGGLNTMVDTTALGFDAQLARNVLTDAGYLEKRPGNLLLTTIASGFPVKAVRDWVAPSGTLYLIAHATDTVYQTNLAGAAVALTTVTAGADLEMLPAFSRLVFADANQPIFFWNGTSTGVVTDAASGVAGPKCRLLAYKDARVFCGSVTGESTSRVRVSSAGGMGYWAVPSDFARVDNAPNVFDFTPDDGDAIQCMKETPWGVFVGKKYSSSMIKGTGNLTYSLRLLDPKIGCLDQRTIQMVNGVLMWLSLDGPYAYDGAGPPRPVNRDLDPTFRNLALNEAGLREWRVNTQADWLDGNLTAAGAGAPMSATIVPGAVIPSTVTLIDSNTTQFALGVCEGCGTSPRGDVVYAGVTSTYVWRYDANAVMTSDGWTKRDTPCSTSEAVSGSSLTLTTNSGTTGCEYYRTLSVTGYSKFIVFRAASNIGSLGSGALVRIEKDDGSSNLDLVTLNNATVKYGPSGLTFSENLAQPSYSTYTVIITSNPGGSSDVHYWRDGVFKASASVSATLGVNPRVLVGVSAPNSGASYMWIDFIHASSGVANPGTSNIVAVATHTSRVYDTAYSTPTFGLLTVSSYPISGTTLAYSVRTSTSPNNDMWGAYSSVAYGAQPPSGGSRYAQFRATFTASGLVDSPGFTRVALPAATTGYYNSAVHFIGSAITAYGNFTVTQDLPNGATTTYQVRSATYAFTDATNIAWTNQTANTTIGLSVSTPTYFQWRALNLFARAESAQTINLVQTNWQEGTDTPVASGVRDRRYFLCVAVSSGSTAADTCFVLQKNGKWVTWEGPQIGSMGSYNYDLVVGDGSTGSKVWRVMQEGVYIDDGAAIDAAWVSADHTNGLIFNKKVYREAWVDALPVQASSATYGYAINKSSAYASVEFTLDNGAPINGAYAPVAGAQYGAINKHLAPSAGYDVGKYFRMLFGNARPDDYFRINSYLLYFEDQGRQVP